MARILLVDEDTAAIARLSAPLLDLGSAVFAATNSGEAERIFKEEAVSLALVSLGVDRGKGLALLARFKRWDPQTDVIVLVDTDSARTAVRAVKLGAFNLLARSAPAAAVRLAVSKALSTRALRQEVTSLRTELAGHSHVRLETCSTTMQPVRDLVTRAARSDVTVLITGESGSGKEVVARSIVALGARANRPLVTVDCGSLPEALIESELFGYEKGAFTGAASRRAGRIELAEGGTVFLDELGNLPLALQPRLLRVLETREVYKLGGTRPAQVDVRFIGATNADLTVQRRAGKFREDLFHRLNVFPIAVPPLRERVEDIPFLAALFLRELNRKHGKAVADLSAPVLARLGGYAWPGNVRELRNVIERAVILADDQIGTKHLAGLEEMEASLELDVGPLLPLKLAKEQASNRAASRLIDRALKEANGDKTRAARLLGVSLKTLYNHLHRGALGD